MSGNRDEVEELREIADLETEEQRRRAETLVEQITGRKPSFLRSQREDAVGRIKELLGN